MKAGKEKVMRNMYDKIEWREPSDEDMKRIRRAIVKNKVESFILLGVLCIFLLVFLVNIRDFIAMACNNIPGVIICTVVLIPFLIFILRRIHLFSHYKVADVTVEEIVLSRSSETSIWATATISQGSTVLRDVNIFSKGHPEAGSQVLLFIENDDSWTVGII